eukprot:3209560-Amphidinium_carterae.1
MPELEERTDVLRVSGSSWSYLTSSAEIARVLEHHSGSAVHSAGPQAAEVAQYSGELIAELAHSLK